MSGFRIPIRHPEWLEYSKPGKTLELYRAGKLPKSIDGWMLVVSLKHPLRAIYGSDLAAAWALMRQAVRNIFDARVSEPAYRVWRFPVLGVAVAWTFAWGILNALRGQRPAFMWGRGESPKPVICACGWAGPRRWAVHGYVDDGSGEEVEPADECPRCGAEV